MSFNREQAAELLAQCHRRCCLCHRFCGVKMELDHMIPSAEGGSDEIKNAIPVCFGCHAEIHAYNPEHPRGRKFRLEELVLHKEQWLEMCASGQALDPPRVRDGDVGPIQGLVDELQFNAVAAADGEASKTVCPLREEQFIRAIREGVLSLLEDGIREAVHRAYIHVGKVNHALDRLRHQTDGRRQDDAVRDARAAIIGCADVCGNALEALKATLAAS